MRLTPAQVHLFRQNGYLKLENALSPETVADLRLSVKEEFSKEETSEDKTSFKLYGFFDRSEPFRKLVHSQALTEPLSDLLGPNVVFVKNRHNHASINDKGRVEPRFHRDILHWSRGLVTAIAYLEDARPDNGCTYVIPGSHNLPFVGVTQIDPPGGGTWLDEHKIFDGVEEQAVPVTIGAGGMLLFDATLFHSVGDNNSDESRISLTMGYRSSDELDDAPAHTQVQVLGEHIYRGNDR